ncbi:MAG TPA: hypothetical protein DEV85_11625 [Vibrio sp.]|nr:hypothetical protein [Vibrio sp.]
MIYPDILSVINGNKIILRVPAAARDRFTTSRVNVIVNVSFAAISNAKFVFINFERIGRAPSWEIVESINKRNISDYNILYWFSTS